jgi:hypothetical protein
VWALRLLRWWTAAAGEGAIVVVPVAAGAGGGGVRLSEWALCLGTEGLDCEVGRSFALNLANAVRKYAGYMRKIKEDVTRESGELEMWGRWRLLLIPASRLQLIDRAGGQGSWIIHNLSPVPARLGRFIATVSFIHSLRVTLSEEIFDSFKILFLQSLF